MESVISIEDRIITLGENLRIERIKKKKKFVEKIWQGRDEMTYRFRIDIKGIDNLTFSRMLERYTRLERLGRKD